MGYSTTATHRRRHGSRLTDTMRGLPCMACDSNAAGYWRTSSFATVIFLCFRNVSATCLSDRWVRNEREKEREREREREREERVRVPVCMCTCTRVHVTASRQGVVYFVDHPNPPSLLPLPPSSPLPLPPSSPLPPILPPSIPLNCSALPLSPLCHLSELTASSSRKSAGHAVL